MTLVRQFSSLLSRSGGNPLYSKNTIGPSHEAAAVELKTDSIVTVQYCHSAARLTNTVTAEFGSGTGFTERAQQDCSSPVNRTARQKGSQGRETLTCGNPRNIFNTELFIYF